MYKQAMSKRLLVQVKEESTLNDDRVSQYAGL